MTTHTWVSGTTGFIYNSSDYVDGTAFNPGDTLIVSSGDPEAASTTTGGVVPLLAGTYQFDPSTTGNGLVLPCYCPGTLIRTPSGETPAEDLEVGDEVVTLSGRVEPIRWVGRRSYAGRFLAANPALHPVRIAAGAIEPGMPARDLLVSPLHALYLDGVLIPAGALVNGSTIRRELTVREVHYIHIELPQHDVIWAEGLPAESFVDDDSRGLFQNAHDYASRYGNLLHKPAVVYAPRLDDGYAVERIRRRLLARAQQLLDRDRLGEVPRLIDVGAL